MEGGESGGGGVRLHVAGIGASVGKDDLLKIFSPMGSVDAVEFVRTKGRSFAYIDFSPSSEKSLTKLFCTYNGCVWKGGRLRLEKAKEHYLARLKREWEESASASDDTVKAPENSTPSTHLNIFFPRLRKVKAMPLSGTGKHKYSFQRVAVPSLLPKTFCDCEEHSTSLTPQETHARDLEALNVGINEEEVNIMNSVMNKLFEKDNIVKDTKDDIVIDTKDNIIINVGSNGNDMMDTELDILSRKRKSSGEGYTEGTKGNHIHPSKKRQSVISEGSGRQEAPQAIREKKKPSELVPDKSSDGPSRATGVKRSNDNISWSQKSSWKALVANGNSSNFSVSSLLPGVSSSKAVQPASGNTDLDGLSSQENSEESDVPTSTTRPTVKTKTKKMKSKRLTSTIMAGNLPVADEIERNDTTATDAVGSDHSEDTVDADAVGSDHSEDTVDADAVGSDHTEDTVDADDVGSDHSEDTVDADAVGSDHSEDTVDADAVGSDHSEDTVDADAVGSDHSEDTVDVDINVNAEPLELAASTKGGSEDDNLNMDKDEDIADDSNAEKESLVLKDHEVDEEKAGKAPLEACSKSTGGSSWLQKASWTQLVSDKNASFSITQLFPDLASDKNEAARVNNNGDSQFSNLNQSDSGMKQMDHSSSASGFEAAAVHVDSAPLRSLEETGQSLKGKNASEGRRLKKPIMRRIGLGEETCTFMRSETSVREWQKAKRALSEPRRKKPSEE